MFSRIGFAALPLILAGVTAQAEPCSNLLLVSGYFSNNVAIYDACSGAFLRQLETAGRIRGAQAVRYNPADDLIYVVSEENDQIQRYRRTPDFEFVDVFSRLAANANPTGIAFGPDNAVYVANYGTSDVIRLDPLTGQPAGVVLPSNSGLRGADNGMIATASGFLYVPGYQSNSVARINLASGQVEGAFVASGSGGLRRTRGIVDEGATILVGGEVSGAIYRYNAGNGSYIATLVSGLVQPTGMILDTDGTLLVLSGNRVRRFDRNSGASLGILANGSDGGIVGGTYIALVPNPGISATPTVGMGGYTSGNWYDPAQSGIGFQIEATAQIDAASGLPVMVAIWFTFAPDGSAQKWVFAQGPYDPASNTVILTAVLTSGGRFPPNFVPGDVEATPWGTLTFSFTDCNNGTASWTSTVPGYGSGSMPITRLTQIAGTTCPS
jgi:sugar lactone lactonase YvrE